jgi:DNA-binding response OmpR family regulator
MSSFDQKPIETIRLDDREKRKLIEAIKKPKTNLKGPQRGVRVEYNSTCVTVSVLNPGGNIVNYSVIPRNLSRHGIAFLHGRFIYPDSRCDIVLQTLDDESMTMEGTIVRCDHLAGTIHEVAASFNSPIDLTLFANMTPAELVGHTEEYEDDVSSGLIEQGQVELGTVLLVEGYKLDRRLYYAYLERANFLCREASNAQEALNVVESYEVDAVVIDVCHEPEYGLDLIGQLLKSSFKGSILAISADDYDSTRESVLAAGAEVFLAKPFDGEAFMQEINQLVGNGAASGSDEPIISSLGRDELMRPLLRDFICESREIAKVLRTAERASDSDQLRVICRQLKGTGGGYGFAEVTQSACDVIEALDEAEVDVEHQKAAVDELLGVLGRLRVG